MHPYVFASPVRPRSESIDSLMQRKRFRILRPVLAAFLLAGAFWSCSDGTGPQDGVVVETVPAGDVDLEVGDTLTVRATVIGARGDVRYSTSDSRVATVTNSGVIKALANGTALITVTSEARASAYVTIQVRVGMRTPPNVTILGLVNALGTRLDPEKVSGTVFVRLSVEQQSATSLQVLVGDTVACTRSFAPSFGGAAAVLAALAPVEIDCPVNTAQFDTTTATPRFRNGAFNVSARLLSSDGTALHVDPGLKVTLTNPNAILVRFVNPPSAFDGTGLRWITGPVTVSAHPVLFGAESPVQRVTFVYGFPGAPAQSVTDAQAPFSTVFPDSFPDPAALAGLVDPDFYINVHTATPGGAAGPEGQTATERYDDAPPTPGRLVSRDWIGAETLFSETYDPTGQTDRGVGLIRTLFFAGDRQLGNAEIIARGARVQIGSDLEQRPRDSYRLAAQVCDVLANCVAIPGFLFGADLTAPRIDAISVPNRAVNPTGNLALELQDDLSGLPSEPIQAAVRAIGNPICGPLVDGIDFPGFGDASDCRAEPFGPSLGIPQVTSGYYIYTLTPVDRAGNRGQVVADTILVDRVPPQVTSITLPTQVLTGEEASFTASATDDLDLTRIIFRLVFPAPGGGALALPFSDADSVGVAFDGQLTKQNSRTTRFPFVRTMGYGAGGTRTTTLVDSVRVQAIDAAGQQSSASRHLPTSIFGNATINDPFSGITATSPTIVDAVRVCVAGCQTGERRTVRLEMSVTATSDFLNRAPFARVYFFGRGPSGNAFLLGSTDQSSGTVGGGVAVWNFRFTYSPPPTMLGRFNVFAVGVNSAGQALRNEGADIDFFARPQATGALRANRARP